jgi:ATP-dependent DNA helicase HFM1/MER3
MNGKIRVLCATSTLAMGVNLPAHLVVIKGTKAWRGGGSGYQDLDQASLLQMIGRAGRPGFDVSGTAVIMTDNDSKRVFERMATSGLGKARSQLLYRLDEIINAEISQQVISCMESAINWIKGTLYFIQLLKNPADHGVQIVSSHSIDTHLLQICTNSIQRLQSIGVVAAHDGQKVSPLAASHTMSQHLVEYQAMALITKIPFDATQHQVLKALSEIEGLHRPVRRMEKKTLNQVHKNLKYKLEGPPSKVRVQEPWEKSFVLLQVYVADLELNGSETHALRQEMNSMVEYSSRMLAALEEYSVRGSKHGNVVVQSLLIRRSLALNLWGATDGVLRQIRGISKALSLSLHRGGISTFGDVLKSSDEQLEKTARRAPPFGMELRKACARILQNSLEISATIETAENSSTPSSVTCRLAKKRDVPHDNLATGRNSNLTPEVTYTLIAYTDRPGGCVLYRTKVAGPGTYQATVPPKFGRITVRLIASIVGLDGKSFAST